MIIKEGFYWKKDDINNYRLIGISKNDGEIQASCPKEDKIGFIGIGQKIENKIEIPLSLNTIFKSMDKEEVFHYLNQFPVKNGKTFDILKMFFIEKNTIKEIEFKTKTNSSSISRIINKAKMYGICDNCKKIIKPKNKPESLKEGYYWLLDDNQVVPIYVYLSKNQFIIKKFFDKKNIGYNFEFYKKNIMSKILPPIQWEDKKTEQGLSNFFRRIEEQSNKIYKNSTKEAVKDAFLNDISLTKSSLKHKASISSVVRLNKKIDMNFCYSCGQLI